MRIAVIGWGSLIWDDVPSYDSLHGPWRFDGPVLPIEFSRVSRKRPGALTLVVDERDGAPCRTAWALSLRDDPMQAVEDLRIREQAPEGDIGFHLADGSRRWVRPVPPSIAAFALAERLDAVVWTGLRGNFAEAKGVQFTVAAALDHLRSLSPGQAGEAADYIRRAPDLVRTPLRDAVASRPDLFDRSG